MKEWYRTVKAYYLPLPMPGAGVPQGKWWRAQLQLVLLEGRKHPLMTQHSPHLPAANLKASQLHAV